MLGVRACSYTLGGGAGRPVALEHGGLGVVSGSVGAVELRMLDRSLAADRVTYEHVVQVRV